MGNKVELASDGQLIFWCPGCKENHGIPTKGPRQNNLPVWEWNGDLEYPTANPSLIVRYNNTICHLLMKNGILEFLSDCTHSFAGTTIEMEDV